MPVARKVWQQVSSDKPAVLARRLIILRASLRSIGRSVSLRCVSMVRKRGGFLVTGNPRGFEIGIDVFLGVVMGAYLVPLAAFLVEAESCPSSLGAIILDLHAEGGTDAGEA